MNKQLSKLWQDIWAALENNEADKAESLLGEFCKQAPEQIDAWLLLAQLKGKMGQFAEMERYCRRAVTIQPDHAVAFYNLAFALAKQGRFAEAIRECAQAISLQADFVEASILLGDLHTTMGNYNAAIEYYELALKSSPDNVTLQCQLADVLQKDEQNPHQIHSEQQRARELYEKVLRIDPGNSRATAGLIKVLRTQGDLQHAYDLMSAQVNSDQASNEIIALYGRMCRHFNTCDQAAKLIEQQLANKNQDAVQQRELWQVLGNIRDGQQQYDAAFDAYKRASTKARKTFNPETAKQNIQRQISAFSTDVINSLPRANNQSDLPVFIIGMPRSGTTLVEQILASHSRIFAAGEIRDIAHTAKQLTCSGPKQSFPESIHCIDPAKLDQLAETYLKRIREFDPSAVRITNKHNPNFIYLGLINRLFPKARIIHIRRDPLDTCLSCYFQNFVLANFYDRDLNNIGRAYRLYEELMAHWQKVIDNPIFDMKYEDLVDDMETVVQQLFTFLDLAWEPACLNFHQHSRVVQTSSSDQVNRPMYRSSLQRWKHYEAYLGPLKAGLGIE